MEIRRERPGDREAVAAVHRAAFARPGPAADEVTLVDRLRSGPWSLPHLSLVAVIEDVVVGHVIATRAVLEPSGTPVLGLGPLGVLPPRQRCGIGSALVCAVLGAAEAVEERLVGLLGDPAYYGRFGFTAGARHGVQATDTAWGEAFQVRVLKPPAVAGTFRYAEPFDGLT